MKAHNAGLRCTQALAFAIVLLVLAFASRNASAAPKGSPWNENHFTNVVLTNQDGKKLKFYDDLIKDKAVMINFIFASCEDACPLETAKLRQVQEHLGDLVGSQVHMYSISITPNEDTPEVLRDYMKKYKIGPGWQFFTGDLNDINMIRRKLGLMEEGEKPTEHTMSMIIGNDKTGVWIHRSSFDNPKKLAAVVAERLLRLPIAGESYGAQSHRFALKPGEDLYRRRCQDCHTIGAGDAIGPDLLDVTQNRERAWLERYLREPNKVLAEKDPIATTLHEKYKEVLMPNLRLSDSDIQMLVGYMEEESRKVKGEKVVPKQAANVEDHSQHQHHHH
jgi:protein SCO1